MRDFQMTKTAKTGRFSAISSPIYTLPGSVGRAHDGLSGSEIENAFRRTFGINAARPIR
jgi:hypothetical protein